MPEVFLDLTQEVDLPSDDDPEVLAAIAEGLEDIEQGRVFTLEEVRATIAQWHTKSSSPKDS
jgi:predicted transcriptional regulator